MNAPDKTVVEYRHSLTIRIAACVICGIMIIAFGWMLLGGLVPALNEPELRRTSWFTGPLALFMLLFSSVAMLNTLKSRISVGRGIITAVTAFSSITFGYEDVRGYRLSEKGLMYLELHSGKKIRISMYLERGSELIAWIRGRFPDLDEATADAERENLRYDARYGLSPEARAARLALAKRVATTLNIVGILCAAWPVYARPYLPALVASLLVPPLILIVTTEFRGLIRVDVQKDSKLPSVFSGLFFSSCVLPIRSATDYHILDHSPVWMPVLLVAVALTVLLRLNNEAFAVRDRRSALRVAGVFLIAAMYGYGAVVTCNCYFDHSRPEAYTAVVESKWVDRGKLKSYNVRLSPYGAHVKPVNMQIRFPQYESLEPGQGVPVHEMQGAFGIPWMRIAAD